MFNNILERNLAIAFNEISKTKKIVLKKIEIPKLIQMLCKIVTNNSPSYRDIALEYNLQYKKKISKQSFYYLFEDHLLPILTKVVQSLIFKTEENSLDNIPQYFKRILLQDSTTIKLPDNASERYSGLAYKKGCKIQATFDVISNSFPNLEITPFTRNDQTYSRQIKSTITNNDLIIRDLGYFSTKSLKIIQDAGAFFISKIPANTIMYNKNMKQVDLEEYLKGKKEIDEVFYITKKSKVAVRIVAKLVSEEKANKRRHIKKKGHKNNPSKKTLKLLSWDIIATNIFDKAINSKTLLKLYRLRWKIEIIFKTWKSHCQINKFHERISENQTIIYMLINLLTIIITNDISATLMPYTKPKNGNHKLSYLSLIKHLLKYIDQIVYNNCRESLIHLINEIMKYSNYDKRRRTTLLDIENGILTDLDFASQIPQYND